MACWDQAVAASIRINGNDRVAGYFGRKNKVINAVLQGVITNQQSRNIKHIAFGNINNPESRVSKMKATDRNYEMLSELNIRPRTTYLARIRNPYKELG